MKGIVFSELNFPLSILALLLIIISVGCTKVSPWQKGNLARPHMSFNPDPLESKFNEHIYASKEGCSGGGSVTGSGCGCN